jgi:predicted ester cyclase
MSPIEIATRNKASYLQAKEAFNRGDIQSCLLYYSPMHQIRSLPAPPGRASMQAFFESALRDWPGLRIEVEHAVAEGAWVMGRSVVIASHVTAVMGAAPTGKAIRTTFWDLHQFDSDGLIAESWNLLDEVSIASALGLRPTPQ